MRGIERKGRTLRIRLTTGCDGVLGKEGSDVVLVYSGVARFEIVGADMDCESRRPVETLVGECIGYDEFDVAPSGFEHMMLLASGGEIVIEARGFSAEGL
ncbi:MAG: hypothetical protein R3B57_01235 [Phycisphaerales bacterium]